MEITYEEFIQNILDTRGRFACGDEYHERHHIVPKCMDGTNDESNLIDLFAREHFEAHRLLALENPDNIKLVYAWRMMSIVKDPNQDRYIITAEEYEESRIIFSKIQSEISKQMWKDDQRRKRHSELMKEKFSGENNPMYGRRGEDSPLYGRHPSKETLENMCRAARERAQNPEFIEKLSSTQKERLKDPTNNPMYGKHHSDETKRKIGNANKGHIVSEETRGVHRQNMKERWQNPEYQKEQCQRMKEVNSRPEYKQKQIESHRGDKSWNAQIVVNVDVNKVYGAAILAKEDLGIDNSTILKCCKGKILTAGGYNWKYAYDYICKDGSIIPGALSLGFITETEVLEQLKKINNND